MKHPLRLMDDVIGTEAPFVAARETREGAEWAAQYLYDPSSEPGVGALEYEQCAHVSYSEQAGGWVMCDDCGVDVTAEVHRAAQR